MNMTTSQHHLDGKFCIAIINAKSQEALDIIELEVRDGLIPKICRDNLILNINIRRKMHEEAK